MTYWDHKLNRKLFTDVINQVRDHFLISLHTVGFFLNSVESPPAGNYKELRWRAFICQPHFTSIFYTVKRLGLRRRARRCSSTHSTLNSNIFLIRDAARFTWFSTNSRKVTLLQKVCSLFDYTFNCPRQGKCSHNIRQTCLINDNVTCNHCLKQSYLLITTLLQSLSFA